MISEPRPPIIIIGDPKEHQKLSPEVRRSRFNFFIAVLLILGFITVFVWVFLRPADTLHEGTIVTFAENTPLGSMLDTLKEKGVIRSVLLTRIFIEVYGDETRVPAGEYFISEGTWLPEVAKQLAKGDHQIPTVKVTFPEGMTNKEMSDLLATKLPSFDEKTFLALAESEEGYLFPNTYDFFATVRPEKIIEMLREEFDAQALTLKDNLITSGKSEKEMVVMASILEGEVKTPEDRALVSGILWKRIEKKMPLQVDATFVYLLGKGSSELTITDLSVDSPYNTYRNTGLPPGPINNPGLDAMRSAITPKDSPYLFYLSGKDGVVHYAKTFDEHKANKAKYLR
jgi:UPF0755 protein